MDNNDKNRKFLDYIKNPMTKESIAVIYDANNIKFEKCELYSDFIQSLLLIAFDTYMGDEVTSLVEQTNHFKWSWEKNLSNFRQEGIIFENPNLYEYFLEFMLEVFYSIDKLEENSTVDSSLILWVNIFEYGKLKTRSEMDTFVEIYQIFEKSLIIK